MQGRAYTPSTPWSHDPQDLIVDERETSALELALKT
jgi:hypothetical protein